MKTKDRLRMQKNLIKDLMEWKFEELGYSKSLSELNIYNNTFLFPFYASSSRGPFFTLRPSIWIQSSSLMAEINAITKYQILMNCTFAFGERLNRFLNIENVIGSQQIPNIRDYVYKSYLLRINDINDYGWLSKWFKHYIETVCFPLMEKIKDPIGLYNFLKRIFISQINFEKDKDFKKIMNSFELSIGYNEIITMVYLGYKYEQNDIMEIARIAKKYKEGPLYSEPVIDLMKHFEK